MKPILSATLLLALLPAAARAQGQVVLEQLPNDANFTFSDADCGVCGSPPLGTGQQSVAENFIVQTDTVFQLNEIVVWGVHDGGSTAGPDLFSVTIHTDNMGLPSVPVFSEFAVPVVAVPTGQFLFGEEKVEYTLSPALPPQLSSGTYWIEISNDTVSTSATWGWVTGAQDIYNGVDGFAFSELVPGQSWWADGYSDGSPSRNLSLRLVGDGATPGGPIVPYCFGASCPCGNNDAGSGCSNSSGAGASLGFSGSASLAADDLAFSASGLLPAQPALLIVGENAINGGTGNPFGDGLRCVGMNVLRLGVNSADAGGNAAWGPGLAAGHGWIAGDVRRFQVWYRDPVGSACGAGFNLSNGLEVNWQ